MPELAERDDLHDQLIQMEAEAMRQRERADSLAEVATAFYDACHDGKLHKIRDALSLYETNRHNLT